MDYQAELNAALDAARIAGLALAGLYRKFEAIPDAPADISTDADRRSQELILGALRRAFPGDAFCAEEETPELAGTARTGPRLWIVDPIDGTRGFARKNGEFSVMVALADEAGPVLGVVLEPALGRLTYALRGGGCWREDSAAEMRSACRVSALTELTSATLIQSHSRDPNVPSKPARLLKPARVIETYSAGIKLARVARGEADLYANTYDAFHDWDVCAGHILVTEAGGTVTGLHGETLRYGLPGAWQRAGLLASNGVLHSPALAALESL